MNESSKTLPFWLLGGFLITVFVMTGSSKAELRNRHYITNQPPLAVRPYTELPLGAIEPQGWLREQLVRMKNGMTGSLDEHYPQVLGPRNGWKGGDGDGWERGPYWLDGLVPLGYILKDQEIIARAKPWIEWPLTHQADDGYFGPVPFKQKPKSEPGIQKTPRRDWWPKMVMLKVLQQYFSATGDRRVINLMRKYFRYQLKELPKTPLGHWTFWGNRRGGDNMMVVYWLYNITGEKFLLELAEILYKQTHNYTDIFLDGGALNRHKGFHCVNLAQGIKQPIIYYQQHPEQKYIDAVKKGFADIRKYHGQPQGMYGGDEGMHGTDPTQGSEFCSTVEMMFSLENMVQITADVWFADHLERVAYNSLPTQANDDFTGKQYFQQANQVMCTMGPRNFYTDHTSDLVYGLITGYPCCLTNMHQAWPKFAQNLWYATHDNGLAALIYAPCSVKAKVADGATVQFKEETDFPFDQNIRFTFTSQKSVEFPLHLRIPAWCEKAEIKINRQIWAEKSGNQIVKIPRTWKSGDIVDLILPMHFEIERWHEDSASVKRGPLVYALRIKKYSQYVDRGSKLESYYEVFPESPWNYGLPRNVIRNPQKEIKVIQKDKLASQPWNQKNAPVELKTKGIRIPSWKLYNNMTGPLPYSERPNFTNQPTEEITLIPYGCTMLRISEFPVIR